MTDKVQLIKQEIERLKEENSIGLCEYDAGYCNGVGETCSEILQFIDSLPEEPASVEEIDCTTCINDKGCVTCENGELHESAVDRRIGYHQGYDQAMQDFLKKAEEFLYLQVFNNGSIECENIKRVFDNFKKYIKNEN